MTHVVIYNKGVSKASTVKERAEYVLGKVPLRHAIGMLFRGVARELEWVDGEYVGPYRRVTAVELVNEMVTIFVYERTGKVMFSKTNVLRRDHYRCAYCGRTGRTIDHVLPRAQGGETTWLNCVAACLKCNGDKADRTPEQAGMRLEIEPYVPTMEDLGMVSSRLTVRPADAFA